MPVCGFSARPDWEILDRAAERKRELGAPLAYRLPRWRWVL